MWRLLTVCTFWYCCIIICFVIVDEVVTRIILVLWSSTNSQASSHVTGDDDTLVNWVSVVMHRPTRTQLVFGYSLRVYRKWLHCNIDAVFMRCFKYFTLYCLTGILFRYFVPNIFLLYIRNSFRLMVISVNFRLKSHPVVQYLISVYGLTSFSWRIVRQILATPVWHFGQKCLYPMQFYSSIVVKFFDWRHMFQPAIHIWG